MQYEILSTEVSKDNPLEVTLEFTRGDWDSYDDPDLAPVYKGVIYGSAHVVCQEPMSLADNPDDFYGYTEADVVLYFMEIYDNYGVLLESYNVEDYSTAQEVQEMFDDLSFEDVRKDMEESVCVYRGISTGYYEGESFYRKLLTA